MERLNCWEFMGCGREEGGENSHEQGICPVFKAKKLDGVHGGSAAGRACWVVAGTMCKGEVSGTFAQKIDDCGKCDFYRVVKNEEGDEFTLTLVLLAMLESGTDL